jgi:hypothetical protein
LTNILGTQWLVEELSLSLSLYIFICFLFNSIFLHQVSKRRELGYAQAQWGFWLDSCCFFLLRSNRNLGELGFVLFTPIASSIRSLKNVKQVKYLPMEKW